MPDTSILPIFILSVAILAITPGQDMALIVARGIGEGRRIALFTVIGFALAGFVQIPLAASGLALVLQSSPWLFKSVKYAGGVYLIYMGLRTINNAKPYGISGVHGQAYATIVAMRDGFLANILNPKVIIFIFAFLPQFVSGAPSKFTYEIIFLGFLMKTIIFIIEVTVAIASSRIGDLLESNHAYQIRLQYLTGSILITLGVAVLFTT